MSVVPPSGQPRWRVPIPRWLWVATGTASRISSIWPGVVAGLGELLARPGGDQLLRAGAGGHALGLYPGEGAGAALGGDRGAEQGVDLLSAVAGRGGGDRLGIAGGERDLGPQAALAVANALGDPGGERLGLERLGEDHLVDRLVDDLLEARHVDPGLLRVEIDVALHLGEEELAAAVGVVVGAAVGLDADHLLDAGDSDAGEADLGPGAACLDVGDGGREEIRGTAHEWLESLTGRALRLASDRGQHPPRAQACPRFGG